MPDEKEFEKHKLYILDKIQHFKQEITQLESRTRQLEIDYSRDINHLKDQIRRLDEATKTFPTKEQIDERLRFLEKIDVENLPGQVGSLQQYRWKMEGKVVAYASIAGIVAAIITIIGYAYL